MQIKLNVSEHLLTLAGTSMLAGGSENVDTIKVTFDSTWNGFGKLAVFNTEKTDSTNVAIDTDGIATIPSLKSKKYLRIGIVGIKNEQTYTTNVIKVYVEDGAVKSESEAPADDVYRQILSMFGEMTTKIEKLTTNLNRATLIAEGKTEYGGGFRLYSLGNLLLIKHIPGVLATGSTSDKTTLFEYGEQYPAVSEDEDRKLANGITLTLTTDRKVKYSTPDQGIYRVESGIDIFMTNAVVTTVVTELPTTNINSNTIYFLKKSDNTYEEYMFVDNKWLNIGGDYSDAEVIDARTGYDGTSYDTLGTAIRTQISELKSDLNDLENKSLSNETKAVNVTSLFTLNGFLNKEGVFYSDNKYLSTDFIKVKQGDVFYLYVSQDDKNMLPIAIYDMNKNFIKGVENKGSSYLLSYLEYEVEEDCLIRIATATYENSLIYKKQSKNNADVFEAIKANLGELETYYENITQFVLDNGEENKRIDGDGSIFEYEGGFISDFIKVEEGDIVKASAYVLYGNPVLILYYGTKKVREVYGTEKGYQTVEVTIPPMVEYVRISSLDKTKGIECNFLKNKTAVEMMIEKSQINYMIPNAHDEMVLENITNGYIRHDGTIITTNGYTTTDFIDLDKYDWFYVVSDYAWGACGYVVFDKDKKVLSYKEDSTNTIKRFNIEPKKEYPNGKYIRICGSSHILKVYTRKNANSITEGIEYALSNGNILYNKKIAFCGDSFTMAGNLGRDGFDNYMGCYKSFGWRIANRNRMKLYHDGIGGSTMHVVDVDNPNTKYPFSYQRYKNVPNDCDYIILQFGLNESSIANDESTKGTKESTDVTTMWGSWNTVLEYLITNHPTSKIGVIMSDAWMPQTYFTTLKEICEWWGVPLLDLGGDANVSLMNGGRRAGCGLTLNPKVAELRNATFYTAEDDSHPNDLGHEWRSTVIENFIRSL